MSGNVVSLVDTKRAVLYNMVIEQGSDLDFPITLVDDDGVEESVAGYTAAMQVRSYTEHPDILHELTTENSRITTDTGKVVLKFSNSDFVNATWRNGVYDLEIISPSGKRERLMEGTFTISLEVTR